MDSLITLFLVEDQQLEREAIQIMLKTCPRIKVVGTAGSAEEAWENLEAIQPNMILLDLNLPNSNPFTFIKQCKRRLPQTTILILTGQQSATLPDRLFAVGASGYLTKDQSCEELIDAIELAATGRTVCAPEIAQAKVMQTLQANSPFQNFQALSTQEFIVARELAKGASSEEAAHRLHLSTQTINCYRHRILSTLKVNSAVELAHLAVKMGIIDVQPITTLPQKKNKESDA